MSVHYIYDELCVAAGFLRITCLYGVSAGSLQSQTGGGNRRPAVREIERAERAAVHLRDRTVRLVKQMEQKGLLLVEPGGCVQMEERLHRILTCMDRPRRMGFASCVCRDQVRRIYCYFQDGHAVAQTADGRGGAEFWEFSDRDALRSFLEEKKVSCALVFERRGELYEPVFDGAWGDDPEGSLRDPAVADAWWGGEETV